MKKTILFSFLAILLCVACSKKDKAQSRTDIITNGSWSLSAVVSDNDANGSYETNDFAGFSLCYTDNFYTFRSNAQLELNEGPTKCAPGDPQTELATWSFTQNETHLMINADEYVLMELNSSKVIIKEELAGGRSSVITFSKR